MDSVSEQPEEVFDAIAAAAKMLDLSEGILTITGACANVRNSMRDEQGWGEEFGDSFAQHGDVTMVESVFHMKAPSMPWCAEVVPQKPQCA